MSLKVEELIFGYPNGPTLLDGLNLTVERGESVSIMAPSGTGKSTLLALIGGLRRPLGGTITVGDPAVDRPVLSTVFQSMHLISGRTVLDNVSIASMSQGMPRLEAEALSHAELTRFKIDHLAARLQKDVSGGESQRVALARAAVTRPQVVLADEPTANLDRANADLVSTTLYSGFPQSALIVTTHDEAVARQAARCLILRDGKLVAL